MVGLVGIFGAPRPWRAFHGVGDDGRFLGPDLKHVVERRLRGQPDPRANPAADTTSRMRAGPACVPNASPTGCDSDDGVHNRVEKP